MMAAISALLVSFALYHLLFGRLFPWCPVKPGYREVRYEKAALLLPSRLAIPRELANIDSVMEDVETFHKLTFKKRVRIILPETHRDHCRLSGVTAAACAYATGTEVFLSLEHVRQAKREPVEILKHELSHAILFQNTSLRNAFRIPEWFREGLAIYYGNPHDNYTGDEFIEMAVDRGYLFDLFEPGADLERIPLEHRYGFLHSEFRCFMEYLVDMFGEDAVTSYAKVLVSDPGREKQAFKEITGADLEEIAQGFYVEVMARRWPQAVQRHRAEGD